MHPDLSGVIYNFFLRERELEILFRDERRRELAQGFG
jgi:hypothetical protein